MAIRHLKVRSKAVEWGTHVPLSYFKLIPKIVNETGEKFVKDLANASVKEIKRKIIRQEFKHRALNPNYLEWKKRKGYDTRILIRQRFFLENLVAERQPQKSVIVYRVGVKDAAYSDGKKLVKIASYLEYGTSKMPARPVFRPTYQIIVSKINSHVKRLANELTINLSKKLPYVSMSKLKTFALNK